MSNQNGRDKGEYVCVDRSPERAPGGVNHNNDRWYPTEWECGTLPCPPFTQNREITCVVCSPAMKNVSASAPSGSVYVRWGGTTCPSGNNLVYSGRAAGSHHGRSGSGANSLCVVNDNPKYFTHSDGNHGGAELWGIQYNWRGSVYAFKSVNGKPVACAVCQVPNKGSTIMVPGENFCPTDWTVEYWGYLMADYHSHQKMNWVCVDHEPKTTDKPSSGSGHGYFYPTEIRCGSIRCDENKPNGYVRYRELTCAVCSPETNRRTTVYTRWGRTQCPSGAQLVRTGFVGSAYYSHTGSGANFLCMTPNVTYADHNDGDQNGALMYGMEYQVQGALRSQEYRSMQDREVRSLTKFLYCSYTFICCN